MYHKQSDLSRDNKTPQKASIDKAFRVITATARLFLKVFTVATAKAMNFGEFCDYNPKNSATVSSDKQKYLMRLCIFSVKSIDFYGESGYNDFLNAFGKKRSLAAGKEGHI